jgi:hypothetical protein
MPLSARIWPNPSNQHFNVEIESYSDEIIKLYISDINGRLISTQNIENKQLFLIGDELKPGIYIATVRQGNYLTTFRLIKQ